MYYKQYRQVLLPSYRCAENQHIGFSAQIVIKHTQLHTDLQNVWLAPKALYLLAFHDPDCAVRLLKSKTLFIFVIKLLHC